MNIRPEISALPPLAGICAENRAAIVRFLRARLGSESDAEDVFQNVFLKLHRFQLPEEIVAPLNYIYRVAANAALDHVRQRSRRENRDRAYVDATISRQGDFAVSDEPGAEDVAEQRQRLERLAAAIDALPPQARRVFVRHRIEGASHAEIVGELGISKSAVEKSIAVAMRHLLKAMADP